MNHHPNSSERPVQRLPVIGQTTVHSPFEAVQRAAIEAAGLPLQVERWERRPHQLAAAIEELRGAGFAGALVAQPHKEKAAGLVNALSDDAKHTGAVNVIVRDGTRLRGYNTDVDGLRAGLAEVLPKVQAKWPRQAVVLGAGGGARAAVSVLISAGLQRIAIFNRHLHRAEALVNHLARHARHMDLRAMPWHEAILEAELTRAGLLVNASGVGAEAGSTPLPAELLPVGIAALDLVLLPETPLVAAVRGHGGSAANGQASFLAASAAAFKLVTGTAAQVKVMTAALNADIGASDASAPVVGD
jgi:shikimate dehydrogenase